MPKLRNGIYPVLCVFLEVLAALLHGDGLGNPLGAPVGLVDEGVLAEGSRLQVAPVEVVDGLLEDDALRASEVSVDVGRYHTLLGLRVGLGRSLGDELGPVIPGDHIDRLGVG